MLRKSPHSRIPNLKAIKRAFPVSPLQKFLLACVLLLTLPACGTVSTMVSSSGGEGAISLAAPSTPQQVAERFLAAWNENDTEAMYALISARSRELYTFETFDRVYTSLSNDIGQQGVSFDVNAATLQGASASLGYDVTIDSELFGVIEDPNRTMRFVEEGDQWRLAWSTMDIFDGFTADASLSVETVPQARANIYDRDGDVVVEERGIVSVLYAQQNLMNTVQDCQRLLADLLYEPLSDVQQDWSIYNIDTIFYVGEIDEQVEIEYRGRLQETCGMSRDNGLVDTRVTRQYFGQGAMVHVTGYIGPIPQEPEAEKNRWLARGYSEGDLIGRAGIELQFEQQLAGRPPRVLRITAPNGTILRELGSTDGSPAQPVYLTIDDELQIETARAVAWGFNYASNSWAEPGRSPGGGAIVMDVNTGAILAMASFPTFSPTLFDRNSPATNRGQRLSDVVNDPRSPLTNRVTQEQYSPGSVYKIISTAAVLNEGLIRPDRIFECGLTWDGSQTYGDTFSPRSDWRLTDGLDATGPIVPSQALTSSCDPFYYEFGAQMFREVGPETIVRYSRMFGIDGPTGLGVYPEAAGNIPTPSSVEEAINNAIGQGNTQTTVLQNAVMVSAVANGGIVYQPYIVQQVGTGDSTQIQGEPTAVGTLNLNEGVLEQVQRGMCDVIADDVKGTAYWIFNDNTTNAPYVACGKTGTAQAGYAPHAWFVAYAPADDPQIAVVAMAQHSREGSEVAAPMVRRIMDAYFDAEPAEFPFFWTEDYVPLEIPDGGTGG